MCSFNFIRDSGWTSCLWSCVDKVRAIDRVMLSGFKNPIIIYTLDLDLNAIEAVPPDPVKREADKKLKKSAKHRRVKQNKGMDI